VRLQQLVAGWCGAERGQPVAALHRACLDAAGPGGRHLLPAILIAVDKLDTTTLQAAIRGLRGGSGVEVRFRVANAGRFDAALVPVAGPAAGQADGAGPSAAQETTGETTGGEAAGTAPATPKGDPAGGEAPVANGGKPGGDAPVEVGTVRTGIGEGREASQGAEGHRRPAENAPVTITPARDGRTIKVVGEIVYELGPDGTPPRTLSYGD
jgi:hypothetical protein